MLQTLLRLFYEFFKTGLFSVGGGLATLPFLYEMTHTTGWFTRADVADMIAISECTPGAIGINMSTYAGFQAAGPLGGVCATLGLATPCIIVILIIAHFLNKFHENEYVNRAFYGLRPASIALITAAGLNVARVALLNAGVEFTPQTALSAIKWPAIALGVIIFLVRKKWDIHPVVFLAAAAVIGIIFKF